MTKQVSVTVPASSGNIGPGFDVLGLALDLRNELHVRVLSHKSGSPVIRIVGEGEKTLPTDSNNIIFKTMEWLFDRAKATMPKVDMVCVNRIPLARGLGSSSSAFLAALLAANRLMNDRFARAEILNFATELEGHPDNVAPSLLGGVQASGVFDGAVVTAALPLPKVIMVAAVPEFELSTKKARKVLPKMISMKDAIANLAAVSLLPFAFDKNPNLLRLLLNDCWHEPHRAKLIPGFHAVKKAALSAGAFGVILSGAGPTMLAFVENKNVKTLGKVMKSTFLKYGVNSKTMEFEIDKKGAVVK